MARWLVAILVVASAVALLGIASSRLAVQTISENDDKLFLPPQQQQDSVSVAAKRTLGRVFDHLCRANVTTCCLHETNLDLLDTLSLTLGDVQISRNRNNNNDEASNNNDYQDKDPPSYRRPSLNCSAYPEQFRFATPPRFSVRGKPPFSTVFSGHVLAKPRPLVDFIMVSYELHVLEARLHEYRGIVDHFVVFESGYNHRGWRKKRFLRDELNRPQNRFVPFQSQIHYVDIDLCPDYAAQVAKERANGTAQSAGKNVWDIQNTLRSCRWKLFQQTEIGQQLPNETLIVCGDLDWLPDAGLLQHMKHCQPTEEYGLERPFHLSLKFLVIASLRMGCIPDHNNIPMALHTLHRVRQLDGLPGGTGTIDRAWDRDKRQNRTIPFYCSGLHLQDIGSLANLFYRDVTHAEFAGFRQELLLDNRTYCNVTDDFLHQKQYQLSTHAQHIHWRFAGSKRLRVFPENVTLPPPTTQLMNALRDCHVPWILVDHWKAFPFAWGYGEYNMYSDTD